MPWRRMETGDLPRVKVLADLIHSNHPEELAVFAERLRLYPDGCHVLVETGDLVGYSLAHPWRFGAPPPLNSRLGEIPRNASTYYIHDVALLPETRGKGFAAQIVSRMVEDAQASGFASVSLVAVNGSHPFWEALGFRTRAVPGFETKLLSYGPHGTLMVRDLAEEERKADGLP